MVPLLNRPFLAYQLALLRQHGVSDVVLACGYRVDDVRRAMGDGAPGVRLRYAEEREPLGTGGAVRHAAGLARGVVFVLNGDILTDADLSAMRRFHAERGARVSIFLTRVADPRQYGLVETAADGRVRRFREKPGPTEEVTTDTINAGVYLIDAALLERVPAGRPASIERDVFPALIADGVPCFGWLASAYWRDIGSPAAYRAAQMDLLEGRVRTSILPAGRPRDGAWLDEGVEAAEARVLSPAVIGARTVLAPGACVGPRAVIGPDCRIGPGARVRDAVLWAGVEVGAGADLRECVVASGARIGAHARVGSEVVLPAGAVVPEHARLPP